MTAWTAAFLVGLTTMATANHWRPAPDLQGRVLFSGLPVPGATITARQGETVLTTLSDADGAFHLAVVESGTWTVRVEMRGFVTETREVTLPLAESPLTIPLTMRRYEEIVGRSAPQPRPPAPVPAEQAAVDTPPDIADAVVINGSVSNGGASVFAQPRAFGNNRPRQGALYTGGVTAAIGNSAWNARPFSFGGSSAPVPSYGDVQVGFNVGGPLKIPGLVKNGPQSYVNYQHGLLHNTTTQSAVMPDAAERAGDFSSSPAAVRDPSTGLPFDGNRIPSARVTPQAAALLQYYPLPNTLTATGANYQAATVTATTTDALQLGMSKAVSLRTTLTGTFAFQRTAADSVSLFGFEDSNRLSSLNGSFNWSRRFSTRLTARAGYQFSGTSTTVTPFFAERINVSGDAGIAGNNQDAANWGPPALSFSDVAGLRDVNYQRSRALTHAAAGEVMLKHGAHNLTIGGDIRRNGVDVSSQSDPRGSLAFTGAATGKAFADFLLGLPATSAIAFRESPTRLRGGAYDGYFTDDWRISNLTMNLGLRWDYESPLTAAIHPDRHGFEPRLAASWRPVMGSSLIVRGSYGVYRNPGVYQPLAIALGQQPPLARAFSVQSDPLMPLTLANPFLPSIPSAITLAVDPRLRAGGARIWQVSAQRDLPASLTAIVAYLGTKGTHLMQASLPNTYPAGADNPCPTCPSGFVQVASNGTSLRNAAQFTIRRRLHNGLTASLQYTLAKSTDDAATFSNTAVTPASLSIAQNWLDLEAERGPSSFDQRQLLAAQVQYTSGVGVAGGTLVDGLRGTLLKDWTVAAQLTTGSGLPFTPIFFSAVAGTGFVGVRPRLTGVSSEPVSAGSYLNPAAYAAPLPGTWGDAGRNSIRGPAQLSLDASVARVFRLRGRLNLEWRLAATNVLNRVTFATIDTTVSSPQFGRATLANPMRRLQITLRLRF